MRLGGMLSPVRCASRWRAASSSRDSGAGVGWGGVVWAAGRLHRAGMKDISDTPQLTEAMLRRGWPEARIRKFLGENLLRVFRQVCAKWSLIDALL